MTPREAVELLELLAERRSAEHDAANERAGLIAASIYNASGRYRKTFRSSDFFRRAGEGAPTQERIEALEDEIWKKRGLPS